MDQRQMNEAIDACRAGSNDLQEPEMAALAEALQQDLQLRSRFEKVQRVDRAVAAAFSDVEVPAGLAERLQAAIENAAGTGAGNSPENIAPASNAEAADQTERSEPDHRQHVVLPARTRLRPTRRALLAVAGVAAIALAIALPLAWGPAAPDELRLAEQATKWPHRLGAVWRTAEPVAHPPSAHVRARLVKWQEFETDWDRESIVYLDDFTYQSDIFLFVIKISAGGEATGAPPTEPQVNSGGRRIAVWKEKNWMYVLIIDGRDDYRAIAPRRPLA